MKQKFIFGITNDKLPIKSRDCVRITGLILVFVLLNSSIFSQDKIVTKGDQQWLQYYNQTKISERWLLLVDGGYRWSNGFTDRSQYLVRVAAGYEAGHGISVAAGFGHWGTYTGLDITASEFRPHQEVILKLGEGKLSINQRMRIEQRFIKSTNNSSLEFDRFNWRFRYFLGLSIPVKEFSKPGMAISLIVADELFINAGKEIVYNIFDHNRILVGPVFELNSSLSFNFLYQGQYRAFNLPHQYHYDHIFWFSIRHRMDLTNPQTTLP